MINVLTISESDREDVMVRPRNLTGLRWIDGIISDLLRALAVTVKIDNFESFPFSIMMLRDLEALKVILAHVRAVTHRSSNFCV